MTDAEFAAAFERGEIPETGFHHRDHIRLAWTYVRLHGEEAAALRIETSIRGFAAKLGKSGLYHQTITLAWMRLVSDAVRMMPRSTFEEGAAEFPHLLEKAYLRNFYSESTLMSDAARESFVNPDIADLP